MINAEKALIEFLSGRLDAPVYADVPDVRPERFVTVEQTGGSSGIYTAAPMIAVQCWAPTRFDASELAREAHDAIPDSVEMDGIMHAECNAPYNFPDERCPRYQFVANLNTI